MVRRSLPWPYVGEVRVNPYILAAARKRLTNEELERIHIVPDESEQLGRKAYIELA